MTEMTFAKAGMILLECLVFGAAAGGIAVFAAEIEAASTFGAVLAGLSLSALISHTL